MHHASCKDREASVRISLGIIIVSPFWGFVKVEGEHGRQTPSTKRPPTPIFSPQVFFSRFFSLFLFFLKITPPICPLDSSGIDHKKIGQATRRTKLGREPLKNKIKRAPEDIRVPEGDKGGSTCFFGISKKLPCAQVAQFQDSGSAQSRPDSPTSHSSTANRHTAQAG